MTRLSANQNHPKKGAAIKVHPIRNIMHIQAIKTLLFNQPRNYCLFVFGINTAFRASELLSLTVGQVSGLSVGSRLEVKQSKTKSYRAITLNNASYTAIRLWLSSHPRSHDPDAPLFSSLKTRSAIQVSTLNRLVKLWCRRVGINENTGSLPCEKHGAINNAY